MGPTAEADPSLVPPAAPTSLVMSVVSCTAAMFLSFLWLLTPCICYPSTVASVKLSSLILYLKLATNIKAPCLKWKEIKMRLLHSQPQPGSYPSQVVHPLSQPTDFLQATVPEKLPSPPHFLKVLSNSGKFSYNILKPGEATWPLLPQNLQSTSAPEPSDLTLISLSSSRWPLPCHFALLSPCLDFNCLMTSQLKKDYMNLLVASVSVQGGVRNLLLLRRIASTRLLLCVLYPLYMAQLKMHV